MLVKFKQESRTRRESSVGMITVEQCYCLTFGVECFGAKYRIKSSCSDLNDTI